MIFLKFKIKEIVIGPTKKIPKTKFNIRLYIIIVVLVGNES